MARLEQPNKRLFRPERTEVMRSFEIVGVVSLFGFLNPWNDTLVKALERHLDAFSKKHLASQGMNGHKNFPGN